MSMQMVHNETDGDATAGTNGAATDADNTAVLTVSLWRAEGLTALVEVDSKLGIVRADPSTGLIFGVAHTALLRKSFKRCEAGGWRARVDMLAAYDAMQNPQNTCQQWCLHVCNLHG